MGERAKIATGFILLAALALYCALRMRVASDITYFLPSSEDPKLAEISRELLESPLTRGMILSIEAPDVAGAVSAGKALAQKLRADPEIAWLRSGPGADIAETFYRLVFPHRFQLLSSDPERELPARFSDAGLASAARELHERLGSPLGSLLKRIAGDDPLLAFQGLVQRLAAAQEGSLHIRDGQFITTDGRCAILFLSTRSSPFEVPAQRALLLRIRAAFAAINESAGGALRLEESGVNRFAVDSERIIHADIDRISIISTLAIVLLFLGLFRSLRMLLLASLPLLAGLLTATAAGLCVYGSLHGLTLAFGSTLLGVCIDYPILFLNHHALEPDPRGPQATLLRVRAAMLLGAFTTLGGFAGLAWTTFPGMRQMALFASVGILGALAASLWLLPALVGRAPMVVPAHRKLSEYLGRGLEGMRERRKLLAAIPLAAVLLCALGLPRLRWADDLSAIQRPSPALITEDDRVRAQVSRMDSGRLIIATGKTEDEALAANDRVFGSLVDARKSGSLDDFRSLHELIFSSTLQQKNQAQLAATPRLFERTAAALQAEGFRREGFQGFAQSLSAAPPAPLRLDELADSSLGDLVAPFRIRLGNEFGILTFLRGVHDPLALTRALAGIEGVRYFDQAAFLASAYGRYRARTEELIGVGLVFVFVMLLAYYRRVGPMLAAGIPGVLAAVTALALLGLLGVEANLLHVVSLLLVVSVGEDYAIFLVASARHSKELRASATSVLLCCLCGVLSFGLLALSEIPALRAIGLTTSLGILLSLLLAPAALLLLPREKAR